MSTSDADKARKRRWHQKHKGSGMSRAEQIARLNEVCPAIDWSLLSGREAIVLRCWLDGALFKEIEQQAGVTRATASKDLKNAIEKLKNAEQRKKDANEHRSGFT